MKWEIVIFTGNVRKNEDEINSGIEVGMKIKSIIVDDEKHGRENLAGILQQYFPEVDLVGEAESVDSAVLLIQKTIPDLVFLDIEMPKSNGFQLLECLSDFRFEVIFVTAYDHYAI